jgi:hypothetical protein
VIRQWWRERPTANVGVVPSSKALIWILDVDPKNGGRETLAELECTYGELPPTVEVLSGSGGRHLYFARTGDPRESALLNRACAPGLDVLTNGRHAVAPPSRHKTGRAYEWEAEHHPDDAKILPAPDWLLNLCARQAGQPTDGVTPYGRAALSGEVERVRLAAESTRNDTLNLSTFKAGQLVEAGHISQAVAASELVQAGLAAGLSAREVRDTVRSGLKGGKRKPRTNVPPVVPDVTGGTPAPLSIVDRFIRELCEVTPGTRCPFRALFGAFARFSQKESAAETETAFGRELERRGFELRRSNGVRYRAGLRLRDEGTVK